MIPLLTRTTIVWKHALTLSSLTLLGVAAASADLYTGTAEQATPNFSITNSVDASGRNIVDADWNTTFIETPPHPAIPKGATLPPPTTVTGAADSFHGAAGKSYNLTIGPDADLFNVGFANDGKSQFNFTPSTNAFFLLMDGASATSRSLITNYGSIGTTYYDPNARDDSASSVAYIQNTDFINYGNIGHNDSIDSTGKNYLSTLAVQLGPNSSFTNYGTVYSSNGIYVPTSSLPTISNVREDNYGLIYTKGGSGLEGTGTMNNFSTGALQDGTNGSYGIQMYAGSTASNWGLINYYTNAVYMAQNTTRFDDYGGPLFPGSYVYVPILRTYPDQPDKIYEGYSAGCTLAFYGALGCSYDSTSPGSMANPGGGTGGSIGMTGTNAGKANIASLHSTIYTIAQNTASNVTLAGTNVLYLPIVTGPIWAGDLPNQTPLVPNTSTLNLYFDGITKDDFDAINSDISTKTAYEPYDGTTPATQTVTTSFSIAGAAYKLVNVRNVKLMRQSSNPAFVPAAYPVGVYSGTPTSRVYYPTSLPTTPPTNLLANPVTLRLKGSGAPALAAGTTYIEAGFILQLGAISFDKAPVVFNPDGTETNSTRTINGVDNYTGSPGASSAIYIDSGMATATGFTIDGADPGTTQMSLPGTLVVDNQAVPGQTVVPTVLPALQGSGQFVQQGTGTTTLTGANTLSGTIFIPRGRLQFAPGATLPNVGGVVMDNSNTAYDGTGTFDLSAGTPTTNVSGSSLGSGFVFSYLKATENPDQQAAYNHLVSKINLGANNLIIGNPAAGAAPANSSFMGQLSGSGALEVAGNATLQLGGSIGSFNNYAGGTIIDPGALVQVSTFPRYLPHASVQPYYMFGTGSLTNNGTLETIGGRPQVGTWGNVPGGSQYVQAGVNANDSGGNHVIYVNGNYTQSNGGNLVLNVNSGLLASGGTPAAAGIASDYLNVGGTITLGTNAGLTLNDLNPTPLTQPSTIVIAQAGSGTLGGANLFALGRTGIPLYEGTVLQVGINSAVIHYGTLANYPGAITLTLFPTGFGSWTSADIGAVGSAGSASYGHGSYTVTGSGADIWGTADAFQFVQQPLIGDGAISARVSSVQNTSGWAKAGVMIRDSLAPGAANAAVVLTPGNGVSFQWRSSANGPSQYTNVSAQTAPNWVKLVRSGNNFTGYYSPDGVTWTKVGNSVAVSAASAAYAGLAVTSHANTKACTAAFDSVNLLPGAGWSSADIGAPVQAGFTSYSDGVQSIYAGGTNLWGTSDQFRYVYQPVSGDFDLSALVADVSDTNPKAKAGLMIRETLASNSPHYFLLATPEQGVFLQDRSTQSANSAYLKQVSSLATPIWLRLKRTGNLLYTFTSTDGVNWTGFLAPVAITLGTNAYIGFAATGSNDTMLGAAEFDSISVSP